MTAAEHIAKAELLLKTAADTGHTWDAADLVAVALSSIGHALIALAVESGVPHAAATGLEQDSG